MRILLVEDDDDLAFGLKLALEKLGYKVDPAVDGVAADHMLLTQTFDLVILDVGLPRMDGLTVLRRLRHRRVAVPVLLLTARDGLVDRVAGLDAGADDYLVKPFALEELAARVRALLRRGTGASSLLVNGSLTVDTAARTACIGETPLTLTPREFVLLELFMQKLGKVLSKQDLIQRFSDWDNEIGENAVEVSVFRLRKKLSPYHIHISTIRAAGYRMEPGDGHPVD